MPERFGYFDGLFGCHCLLCEDVNAGNVNDMWGYGQMNIGIKSTKVVSPFPVDIVFAGFADFREMQVELLRIFGNRPFTLSVILDMVGCIDCRIAVEEIILECLEEVFEIREFNITVVRNVLDLCSPFEVGRHDASLFHNFCISELEVVLNTEGPRFHGSRGSVLTIKGGWLGYFGR